MLSARAGRSARRARMNIVLWIKLISDKEGKKEKETTRDEV